MLLAVIANPRAPGARMEPSLGVGASRGPARLGVMAMRMGVTMIVSALMRGHARVYMLAIARLQLAEPASCAAT